MVRVHAKERAIGADEQERFWLEMERWRIAKGVRQGGEGEGSRHSSGGELGGKWRPQLGEQALV